MCKYIYAATVKVFTPITCHPWLVMPIHVPRWPKPNVAAPRGNLSQLDAAYSQVTAGYPVTRPQLQIGDNGEILPHVTALVVRSRLCSGNSAWKIRTGMRQVDSFQRQSVYLED